MQAQSEDIYLLLTTQTHSGKLALTSDSRRDLNNNNNIVIIFRTVNHEPERYTRKVLIAALMGCLVGEKVCFFRLNSKANQIQ